MGDECSATNSLDCPLGKLQEVKKEEDLLSAERESVPTHCSYGKDDVKLFESEAFREEKLKKLDLLLKRTSRFLAEQISGTSVATKRPNSPAKKRKEAIKRQGDTSKKRKLDVTGYDGEDAANRAKAVRKSVLDSLEFSQPRLIEGIELRDYQIVGIEWLTRLYMNGLNGILADEMGLGKTIQVVGLIAHLTEKGVGGPFLIVAPLSTLPNWLREFREHAPSIPALLYHGSKEEREALREQHMTKDLKPKSLKDRFPVILTSFEICIRDSRALGRIPWKYLVVDEGHRLKNKDCRLLRELTSLRSENRLLLTGTPLQNNLAELWSLLHFVMPMVFDDFETLSFIQAWKTMCLFLDSELALLPVEGSQSKTELSEAEQNANSILHSSGLVSSLHSILDPFILRRLKRDVHLNLPPKRELVLYTTLTGLQRKYYELIQTGNIRQILPSVADVISLMNKLMQLRKVCNHPYLVYEDDDDKNVGAVATEKLVEDCGKLQLLDRILPRLFEKKHKVLIFSQMTRMLDILEDYLFLRNFKPVTSDDQPSKDLQSMDRWYCRFDGSTPFIDREVQINVFNENAQVKLFLLSTRAGGLGINLTAADTVILYDSDWNPHVDQQAMDRCHRIGQERLVDVYRFISKGTVEEIMLERAIQKKRLEKVVMHEGKFKGDILTATDTVIAEDDINNILKCQELQPSSFAIMSDDVLKNILSREKCGEVDSHGFKVIEDMRTVE